MLQNYDEGELSYTKINCRVIEKKKGKLMTIKLSGW